MLKGDHYQIDEMLFVIEELKKLSAKSYKKELFSIAKNFYSNAPKGNWEQKNFQSKKYPPARAGNTINEHKDFIENYIQREKPIVIALNANMHINSELINYRIASHPLRILADAKKFQNLNQPIITPTDLSSENNKIWENKKFIIMVKKSRMINL